MKKLLCTGPRIRKGINGLRETRASKATPTSS